MSQHGTTKGRIDRLALIRTLGSAGATAAWVSAAASPALGAAQPAKSSSGALGKTITLAATGPGGNPNYVPEDDLKFLPPQKIPAGQAADLFASLPKEKLLASYERISSRV